LSLGSGSSCDGFDNTDVGIDYIVSQWTEFTSAEALESGSDGRNVWDYWDKHYQSCTELRLNCLAPQEQ
jgi:hypothetical protein